MGKIIAFAGRLRSGKTELAKICENYGYERLYFAKPLKELIASLIDGDVDDVNRYKLGNEDGTWVRKIKDMDVTYIAKETGISIGNVASILKDYEFHNTREMLQVIGTDLIRKFNPNWHVERTIAMIDPNKDYVIDDVRFTNEKNAIEQLGGDLWFVVRPELTYVSNHPSESTLKWQDFDKIIINKYSLNYLRTLFVAFMSQGYDNAVSKRNELWEELMTDEDFRKTCVTKQNPFDMLHCLMIFPEYFEYTNKFQNNTDISSIETTDEGEVFVVTTNDMKTYVNNPLEIEDLKFYMRDK